MNLSKQYMMLQLGQSGCYELCIHYIAEHINENEIDSLYAHKWGVQEGLVEENCWVVNATRILQSLTNRKLRVLHVGADYRTSENEYEIVIYQYNPEPGVTIEHRVVGDKKGGVEYDPYTEDNSSPAVVQGRVVGKRIVRVMDDKRSRPYDVQ